MIEAVSEQGYQKETVVSTLLLNSRGMLVWKSVMYKVDDLVECRLEDNPLTMSVCPQDRRKAAMSSRWFKGTISAIRKERTLNGDEIVIAVQLPGNNVDKILTLLIDSLRSCFKCVCCKLRAKAEQATPNSPKLPPTTPTNQTSPSPSPSEQVVTRMYTCLPCGDRRTCLCNIESYPYASTYVLCKASPDPDKREIVKAANVFEQEAKRREVTRREVAQDEILQHMKDRVLYTIHEVSESPSNPAPEPDVPTKRKLSKKQSIAVAQVFNKVTPVFNAVARATSMDELKVCFSTCNLLTTEACAAYQVIAKLRQ